MIRLKSLLNEQSLADLEKIAQDQAVQKEKEAKEKAAKEKEKAEKAAAEKAKADKAAAEAKAKVDAAVAANEAEAWKKYTDAGYSDSNLPVGTMKGSTWSKEECIRYELEYWQPLMKLNLEIELFWAERLKPGSEANNLFSTSGIQGDWFWEDDNEVKARDLWWRDIGSKQYARAKALRKQENSFQKRVPNTYGVTNALKDGFAGDDSIYEEITEVVNNEVTWDCYHAILWTTYEFTVDPEIDV